MGRGYSSLLWARSREVGTLGLCAVSLSLAPDSAGRAAPSAALRSFLLWPKVREQSSAPLGGWNLQAGAAPAQGLGAQLNSSPGLCRESKRVMPLFLRSRPAHFATSKSAFLSKKVN